MTNRGDIPSESIREDVLIGRVVDGEASAGDWSALERLASSDAGVWRRIAQAQRDHARLERAVEDRIAVAELVNLPLAPGRRPPVLARIGQWGGWAAAAVVTIVLGAAQLDRDGVGPAWGPGAPQVAEASLFGPALFQASPQQAFDRYISAGMADGRVVAEMPATLLEFDPSRLDAQPGQILIVRRIVERVDASSASVLTIEANEHGDPAFVPADLPAVRRTDAF
jgi:hypothetical protein